MTAPPPDLPPEETRGTVSSPRPLLPGATAAVVLGILSLATALVGIGVLFGIAGYRIGRGALRDFDRTGGRFRGEERARLGTQLSLVGLYGSASVILLVLLRPLFFPPRTGGMKTTSQLRGTHQAMVIFAGSNNGFFPGLNPNGRDVTDLFADGSNVSGTSPAARYWILLNGQYFTGELAINPADQKTKWTSGRVTTANFSYAMLSIAGSDADGGRRAEWKDNANPWAVLASDRALDGDRDASVPGVPEANLRSIWTRDKGDWKGNVVWGDNHAAFEVTHRMPETRYSNNATTSDSLFADGREHPSDGGEAPRSGWNALMVWQ